MRTPRFLSAAGLLVFFALLAVGRPAAAATLVYDPQTEFSGSGSNYTGVITYTLEDTDTDEVTLTIEWEPVTTSAEFLTGAYLNVATAVSWTGTGSCTTCTVDSIAYSSNAYMADGDGNFDFLISFASAEAGRFQQGDTFSIVLTAAGLTVDSFDLQSTTGGGNGIWYAAARVQGLGSNAAGSGWFGDDVPDEPDTPNDPTVPEPATLALLGTGLAAVAGASRRRRKNQK